MKPPPLWKSGVRAMIARSMSKLLPQGVDNWVPVGVIIAGIMLVTGLAMSTSSSYVSAYILHASASGTPPIAAEAGTAAGREDDKQKPKDDGRGVNPARAWILEMIYGGPRPFGFGFFK